MKINLFKTKTKVTNKKRNIGYHVTLSNLSQRKSKSQKYKKYEKRTKSERKVRRFRVRKDARWTEVITLKCFVISGIKGKYFMVPLRTSTIFMALQYRLLNLRRPQDCSLTRVPSTPTDTVSIVVTNASA